ncbi:hypothetical protein [Zooshikella ganghwensis]|uniref:RIFT barrel domain-containing protein n=1 Tax=Zooshikella ganghwensis TaxID=202772 RepID=UPI0012FA6610|nr:hypothetical protein [Zooshikella ganghwensis]
MRYFSYNVLIACVVGASASMQAAPNIASTSKSTLPGTFFFSQAKADTSLTNSQHITDVAMIHEKSSTAAEDYVTFGHVFKVGDVPQGKTVLLVDSTGKSIATQVDKKATYQDGSLKHAIISAKVNIPSAKQQTLRLFTIDETGSTTGLNRTQLAALDLDFTLKLTVGGNVYTSKLADVIESGELKRQWLEGGIANEFIFTAPLKVGGVEHPLLHARFYVRTYGKREKARVTVVVENSYSYVANPSNVTYDVELIANGQSVYQKSNVTHYHHARWKKDVLLQGQALTHVVFNRNYLMNSKAFPLYQPDLNVASGLITNLYSDYQAKNDLMKVGTVEPIMPMAGGRYDIGPMPAWSAAYLLSQDKRLKTVTEGNANLAGSWSVHYRDKKTGYMLRIDDWPYAGLWGNDFDHHNPKTDRSEAFPACKQCQSPYKPDSAHQPSLAYLPYVVTGDYYLLEELQFWANYNLINMHPYYRRKEEGILRRGQVRGEAWSLRALGEAAFITPDNHPMKYYFSKLMNNNLEYLYNLYVARKEADRDSDEVKKRLGYDPGELIDRFGVRTGEYAVVYKNKTALSPWMDDFHAWSIGFLKDLGFAKASEVMDKRAKFSVGRMIDPGYCWIFASLQQGIRVLEPNNKAKVLDSFAQAFNKTTSISLNSTPCDSQRILPLAESFSAAEDQIPLQLNPGQMLGYAASPEGFPANMQIALAAATDSNYPSASQAWSKFEQRSYKPDYSIEPQFAVVPRSMYAPSSDKQVSLEGEYGAGASGNEVVAANQPGPLTGTLPPRYPEPPEPPTVPGTPSDPGDTTDTGSPNNPGTPSDPGTPSTPSDPNTPDTGDSGSDDDDGVIIVDNGSPEEPQTPGSGSEPNTPTDDTPETPTTHKSLEAFIEELQPGQWLEAKGNNTLSDAFPSYHSAWGSLGPAGVLGAWSGGAVGDNKLIIWGGGKTDYGGNEVYQMDFDTLSWSRLTDPSEYYLDNYGGCITAEGKPALACITKDGTPTSAHSYDGVEYLPNVQRFWMGNGTRYGAGYTTEKNYWFDSDNTKWEQKSSFTIKGEFSSAYDSSTGYLLVANGYKLIAYDPKADKVTHQSPVGPNYGGASPGVYDPKRKLFIQLLNHSLAIYDLSEVDWQDPKASIPEMMIQPIKLKGKQSAYYDNGQGMLSYEAPTLRHYGIDYDSKRDVFVLWDGHNNVLILDPSDWSIQEFQPQALSKAPSALASWGGRRDRGIYGRWRYLPDYDCFIGFNKEDEGVWLFRLPNEL